MTTKKKAEKTENKQKNRSHLFQKGQSGNPAGRPKGSKSFKTVFMEAVNQLAKENEMDPKSIEMGIVLKAVAQARKGEFNFYRDLMDRLYGKAKQSIEIDAIVNSNDLTEEQKEKLDKLLNS